jgi:hypothetical protein
MANWKQALLWSVTPVTLAGVFLASGCEKKNESTAPDSTVNENILPADTDISDVQETYADYDMAAAQVQARTIWEERSYKPLYLLDAVERFYDGNKHRIVITLELESPDGNSRFIGQTACTNDEDGCRPVEASLMNEFYWTRDRAPDFAQPSSGASVVREKPETISPPAP